MPLFWVVGAAAMVIAAANGTPYQWERVATGLTILPLARDYAAAPLHQGWTLAFEIAFYLTVAAAVLVAPRLRYAVLLAALAALSALSLAMPLAFATARFFANGIVLEFAFGVGVHRLWANGLLQRSKLAVLLALAGLTLLVAQLAIGRQHGSLLAVVEGLAGLPRALDWGLPCALIMAGLLPWRPGDNLISRTGLALGEMSYSLYLVHIRAIEAVTPILIGRLPPLVVVVAFTIIGIASGAIVYKFIEQPMLRVMRGRRSAAYERGKAVGSGVKSAV